MIIYLIKNKVNGKGYVGKTERTLEERWREHVYAHNSSIDNGMLITRAMKKYGIECFELKILEQCVSEETLNEAEVKWIDVLETYCDRNKGYNLTKGGEGGTGRVCSPETRELLSVVHKRENLSDETIEKMKFSAKKAGGWSRVPNESREKVYEDMRNGKNPMNDAQIRKKVSCSQQGKLISQEIRDKISDTKTGTTLTENHKYAIKVGVIAYYSNHIGPNLGKSWSDETRQKQALNNFIKKKPIMGFDETGLCVVLYFSLDDAIIATGLGHRILSGNRKKYRPKYVNGITYKRSELTISELKIKN